MGVSSIFLEKQAPFRVSFSYLRQSLQRFPRHSSFESAIPVTEIRIWYVAVAAKRCVQLPTEYSNMTHPSAGGPSMHYSNEAWDDNSKLTMVMFLRTSLSRL